MQADTIKSPVQAAVALARTLRPPGLVAAGSAGSTTLTACWCSARPLWCLTLRASPKGQVRQAIVRCHDLTLIIGPGFALL